MELKNLKITNHWLCRYISQSDETEERFCIGEKTQPPASVTAVIIENKNKSNKKIQSSECWVLSSVFSFWAIFYLVDDFVKLSQPNLK
jgi:hypothetical protein